MGTGSKTVPWMLINRNTERQPSSELGQIKSNRKTKRKLTRILNLLTMNRMSWDYWYQRKPDAVENNFGFF